jgi:hypothetical protein
MRARIQTIYQRPRGVPIFQEAMEAVINEIWEVMWIFAFLCFSLAFCPTIWPAVDSLSTNDMNVLSVSKFKCFTDLQRGKRPRRFEVIETNRETRNWQTRPIHNTKEFATFLKICYFPQPKRIVHLKNINLFKLFKLFKDQRIRAKYNYMI